ncbi:MAG: SLBB domain-containing protein [Phormidesmis sp. CAN_BIN44]|nr:SLBB domain-containing protein [Phormidesmis sp. CAN_BIN44]
MRKFSVLLYAPLVMAIAVGTPPSLVLAQTQSGIPTDTQTTTPLKPGDQLRLTVAGFPDLSNEQLILSDGTIQLPMVGVLKVSRLTPIQAAALIKMSLQPYVRRPQVALSLVSPSPLRVSVTGEVLQPGPRLLNPFVQQNQQSRGTGNAALSSSPVTVSDVLILAGGITPDADLRNIMIRRIVASDPTSVNSAAASKALPMLSARNNFPTLSPGTTAFPPPGASLSAPSVPTYTMIPTEIKVDLWEAVKSGNLSADARIYDGDEIIVPRAKANNAEQQALLTSTIAPNKITVQVTGEVNRPGQVDVSPTARVIDSIAAAGGTTDKANKRTVELFRMSPQGQLERQTFDLDKPSISLRDGDLLVVQKTGSSKFIDTLGRIVLPIFPLTTILNLFR